MPPLPDPDVVMGDEYDEEADSDFQEDGVGDDSISAASEDDEANDGEISQRPRKRRKTEREHTQQETIAELDSGDEATIREQKKSRNKNKKQADGETEDGDGESKEWCARTRAMRTREKEERKQSKLASVKGSTIDVDKIWEDMNRSEELPPPHSEPDGVSHSQNKEAAAATAVRPDETAVNKENTPAKDLDETITIKRTYKFAGEVHVEERTVLKSSAEAQLWLAQQQSSTAPIPAADGRVVNRPLRKLSRFDPNFSNLGAFKASWAGKNAQTGPFKGPKLNVVEKSKMDWAVHVDAEGFKAELDTHAKAREGYLGRMDFLRGVEERKEAEARAARLKAA
ncbi:swr complex subunit [Exophiala xenobiotica]|nr:swr complex subunit [Exophiala xenobiotica]KAK5302503.1 swr complex subunit [Exophiala xenobiotica]KAK5480639.1 swr complex subunit [Exophiala xenobiotica]